MLLNEKNQPIIAISTAQGVGAVGVVRVSGLNLKPFIQALFKRDLLPRTATLCTLRDSDDSAIDQLLCIYFPAPHSYTGEDVLELQGHGGPTLLNMIVQRCIELASAPNNAGKPTLAGLRTARPGEFSERAFLNSKLDLAQAEAVMDLINASTKLAAKGAIRSLQGEFSKEVNALKEDLIHLRVWVEASIDFPEEEIDFIKSDQVSKQTQVIKSKLEALISRSEQGRVLSQGINVVIAGQPNAGKSSLLNTLSGEEIAIVTDIAGTTRDVLKETIAIEGVPFHISDTAGLRTEDQETIDAVEKIGIQRAWERIVNADILIYLHDLSRMQDARYEAQELIIKALIESKGLEGVKILHVYNKLDIGLQHSSCFIDEANSVKVSAKEGLGIEELKKRLLGLAGWNAAAEGGIYLARQRHLDSLGRVQKHVLTAVDWINQSEPRLEFIAEELRLAQNSLNEITGEFTSDDLLGEIFAGFCIGK
jgi:tRNA modification GTPase